MTQVVYFLRMDGRLKIGTSRNLESRLQSLRTGTPNEIKVLLTIPGGRELELLLHRLFDSERINREFFRLESRVTGFMEIAERSVSDAIEYAEKTKPISHELRELLAAEARLKRAAEVRAVKRRIDEECRELVNARKATIGY